MFKYQYKIFPNLLRLTFGLVILFGGLLWSVHKEHNIFCANVGGMFLLITLSNYGVYWISQRKRLDPSVREITAIFSHELKTPLTSIDLMVHNLLNYDYFLSRKTRENIAIIGRENMRLTRFVDSLVSLALIEEGRYSFFFEYTYVNDVVHASIAAMNKKYEKKDIALNFELADNTARIRADKKMLQFALSNLLDNSYQYTRNGKPITLHSYESGGNILIVIADRGVGISGDDSRKVFDKYYRVDQSLQSQAQGCGIGLTLASYIITKHGGRIMLDSRIGQGSVFTVVLPILYEKK